MTQIRDVGARSFKQSGMRPSLLAAGSVLGAIGASTCCIVPLVLFGLGAGGAWTGNLTALAPYQPFVVAATAGFIGVGFYMVYRKPTADECEPGSYCANPGSGRVVKAALWAAAVLVVAATLFPYVAPLLLGR